MAQARTEAAARRAKRVGRARHEAWQEEQADLHELARRWARADIVKLVRYAKLRPRTVVQIDRWVLRRAVTMGEDVRGMYVREMRRLVRERFEVRDVYLVSARRRPARMSDESDW